MSVESIRSQTLIILASLANSPRIAAIEETLAPLPHPFFTHVFRACIADLACNQSLISYIINHHWQPFGMRAEPIPAVLIDDVRVAFIATHVERGENDAQIREAWANLGKLGALVARISPEPPQSTPAAIPIVLTAQDRVKLASTVAPAVHKGAVKAISRRAHCLGLEGMFIEQLINDPTIDSEQRARILESMHSSIASAAKPPSDEVRESGHEIVEEGPYDYAQRGIHEELAQACMDARGKPHEPLDGEEEPDIIEKLSTEEIAQWEKELAEERAKQAKQAQKVRKVYADRARIDGAVPISGIYRREEDKFADDPTADIMKQEVDEFREALARDEDAEHQRIPKFGGRLALAPPPRDYTGDMVSRCLEYHTTDHEVAVAEAAVRADGTITKAEKLARKSKCQCAPAFADDTFNAYRRDIVYGDEGTTKAELQRKSSHAPVQEDASAAEDAIAKFRKSVMRDRAPGDEKAEGAFVSLGHKAVYEDDADPATDAEIQKKYDEMRSRERKRAHTSASLADITDDDVMREMARVTRECLVKDRAKLARDEAFDPQQEAAKYKIEDHVKVLYPEMPREPSGSLPITSARHCTPGRSRAPLADVTDVDVMEEMARVECAKALPDIERHIDTKLAHIIP
jgi:hypothetical protein